MKPFRWANCLALLAATTWIAAASAGAADLQKDRLAQAGTGSGSSMNSGSASGANSGSPGDSRVDPNTGMRSGATDAARGTNDEDPRSAARRSGTDDGATAPSAAQRGMGSGTGSPNTGSPNTGMGNGR